MSGRPPNAIEQRVITGNPEHRPLPMPVIVGGRIAEGDDVPMPPEMNDDEQAAFVELLAPRVRAGLLDFADLPAIENAARALAEVRTMSRKLGKRRTKDSWRDVVTRREAMKEFRLWTAIIIAGPGNRARAGLHSPKPDGGLTGELGRSLPKSARLRVLEDGD